ncbi:hypothetical protein NAS141_17949 [Sulfitobacter sp. NAS-14.1]|nr:hypothetical protein NAS141_17949 [Sulfitobacter sp. NAS-14.1]
MHFFHLEFDIAFDLVFGEDVTGQQVIHIRLQLFQRFAQGTGNGRDIGQFFGGQIIEVFIHGFARIDLVLDPVKAGHQQRGKAQVGVCRRIGEAGLYAFCLGGFGPWDTDTARAVACGIGAQNGGFETGDQTLVAVGRRVGEGVQRFRVGQDAADEIQRFLAQVGIFVACEQGLAVFPDRHVHVHAGAVVAIDWLGHEGCGFTIGVRHVVDHVFVFLQLVRLFGQRAEDQAQFVLAGRHFVVVFVDLHAKTFHGRQHFGAQVLCFVRGVHGEVAVLEARAVAHVAHFIVGVGVPGRVRRINFVGYLVDRVREFDVVEQKEFGFRTHIGHIADARGFQIGFGFLRGAAGVTLIGFACVGLYNRAVHADGFFGIERINISGVRVEHQLHVGGFDAFPTRDGGAVKHEPFFDKIFVNKIGDDCHVLQFTACIGETYINVFDVLVLDLLQEVLGAHWMISFS